MLANVLQRLLSHPVDYLLGRNSQVQLRRMLFPEPCAQLPERALQPEPLQHCRTEGRDGTAQVRDRPFGDLARFSKPVANRGLRFALQQLQLQSQEEKGL